VFSQPLFCFVLFCFVLVCFVLFLPTRVLAIHFRANFPHAALFLPVTLQQTDIPPPAAIDVGSGKSAHYEWTEGQDSAAEQAALALFNTILGPNDCSCDHVTYAYGTCSLDISVCFMFNSTSDLVAKKPSFKAWCSDLQYVRKQLHSLCFCNSLNMHSRAGQVFQYDDPQDAASAAGEDLLAKYPDEPTLCNTSVALFRALFEEKRVFSSL
jgi:hypothetical protein